MCVYIYVYVDVDVDVDVYVYAYVYVYVDIYTDIYICTYCTHTDYIYTYYMLHDSYNGNDIYIYACHFSILDRSVLLIRSNSNNRDALLAVSDRFQTPAFLQFLPFFIFLKLPRPRPCRSISHFFTLPLSLQSGCFYFFFSSVFLFYFSLLTIFLIHPSLLFYLFFYLVLFFLSLSDSYDPISFLLSLSFSTPSSPLSCVFLFLFHFFFLFLSQPWMALSSSWPFCSFLPFSSFSSYASSCFLVPDSFLISLLILTLPYFLFFLFLFGVQE